MPRGKVEHPRRGLERERSTGDDEHREPGRQLRGAVDHHSLQPEVRVGLDGKHGCARARRPHEPRDLLGAAAAALHGLEGERITEPEVAVTRAVEVEARPLHQDRQVLGLLHLDEQHSLADGVQYARRHVDDVARRHADTMQETQQPVGIELLHEPEQLDIADAAGETQVHLATLQDVPRLGFAVRAPQVPLREVPGRVRMHGQALTGVEEFHEEERIGAPTLDVRLPEPPHRVGGEGFGEQAPIGQRAESDTRLPGHGRDRGDPVLGLALTGGRFAAEVGDAPATPVEALGRAVRG